MSMSINVSAYVPGDSPVHRCDPRVKIVLLVVYSVVLFVVKSWVALGLCALIFLAVALASRVPMRRYVQLAPVYVLVAFTVLFNSFAFDVSQAATSGTYSSLGNVSAGLLEGAAPIALIGSFGFLPAGFARGCFYAVRILLLVMASLVLTYTSTSTDLTDAFTSFLRPLRPLHVPVDDIAMVLSIALRFIPVTAAEFGRIHDAQWARGASFDEGSLWRRISAWATIFIPLFVNLFRRADSLAVAMDARCYGAPDVVRTSLKARRMSAGAWATLLVGIALLVAIAALL